MKQMEYLDRIDNLPILILPISFYTLHAKRSRAWNVTVHKRNDIHCNKKHKGLRIIKEILKYENMQKPIKHKWRLLYMWYLNSIHIKILIDLCFQFLCTFAKKNVFVPSSPWAVPLSVIFFYIHAVCLKLGYS